MNTNYLSILRGEIALSNTAFLNPQARKKIAQKRRRFIG